MNKILVSVASMLLLIAGSQVSGQDEIPVGFFLTSSGSGNGADLGGLDGADDHCQALAEAAGLLDREWRAYLSTDRVNAKARIGNGPWHNVQGELIANDVGDLHSENANINKDTALDENGNVVNGSGDTPNRHDILTGTRLDGTRFDDGEDHTCSNWTTNGDGTAHLGHHDRLSRGEPGSPWNDAHPSRGCGQDALKSTGGDGLFYCFAAD